MACIIWRGDAVWETIYEGRDVLKGSKKPVKNGPHDLGKGDMFGLQENCDNIAARASEEQRGNTVVMICDCDCDL